MNTPSKSSARLRTAVAFWLGLGASLVPAEAQVYGATPWNPATPLPQFITHVFIDPANLIAIAKYRSGVGHVFSDDYEDYDRSLKNYFEPLPRYVGTVGLLPEFAPANGTIISIEPEGQVLSTGEHRGNQIALIPDGYPMFQITMFHCDQSPNIVVGTHVNAGDPIGFADIRESQDVDFAVAASWNATPIFSSPGVYPTSGQVLKAPAYRLLSPFDVMSDSAFAAFAPYGLTDRSRVVVPLAYRNFNPGQFLGEDYSNLDPIDFFIFPVLPLVQVQPNPVVTVPGQQVVFTVTPAETGSPVAIQWNLNGVPIPGATKSMYSIYPVQTSDMGSYTATLTSFAGSTQSATAILTVTQTKPTGPGTVVTPSRLINISANGLAPTGGTVTAGFWVRGAGSKSLLLRGVGPGLSQFGVQDPAADTQLTVFSSASSTPIVSDDDWVENAALDAATAATHAFPLVPGGKDAAALASLSGDAGYTMQVGPSGPATSGTVLAEVYDTDPLTSPTRITNISTRGYTASNANILTVGFDIAGTTPKQLLIRVVGPGLTQLGVPSVLADPQLTLIPAGTSNPIASNSNWSANGQATALQAAFAAAYAFPLTLGSNDAAVLVTLSPGAYTVQATGVSGDAGTVLIEVYDLDP